MSHHIASAAGISVLLYIGYVAVAPTPADTLNRSCAPFFDWPKKALVSAARIFSPSSEQSIDTAFDHGFNRCRAWGWGVFYDNEYKKLMNSEAARIQSQPKPIQP
jgi:hypothetical protein